MLVTPPHLLASWGLTTGVWVALWAVLSTLTVILLALLRTRWSRSKPWRRYAILSLWVHVLLACAAMTVRIVAGAPHQGDGDGEVVQVTVLPASIIEEVAEPITETALAPPPLEQTHLVAPDLAPIEPVQTESTPKPVPELTSTTEVAISAPAFDAPSLMPAPPSAAGQESSEVLPPSPVASDSATPLPQLGVPSAYAERFAANREQIAEQGGGSAQTEKAVRKALAWLATAQSDNGGWDASKYGAGKEQKVMGHDRGGAGANADTGVTGLALLAFLGSGHSHRTGSYTQEVAAGLEYLRQQQRRDGSLFGEAELFARMYCHSMATFAVCEALALTKDPRLEPMANAAVRFGLTMQHPTDGGWRYRRGDTGDTSQLGWQVMTLKSAELAGINVPPATWTRVESFLRRVRRGSSGGLACYRPETPTTRTMTAEALFCRQLLQPGASDPLTPAATAEAIASLREEMPDKSRRNLYYWYYATLALHNAKGTSPAAAEAWEEWNEALTAVLVTTQQDDGSWDNDTTWGGYGGRVYTTALSAMCLEVYYRYSPTTDPAELARRRQDWHSEQR